MKYVRLVLPILWGVLVGGVMVLPQAAVAETLQELLPAVVRIIAKAAGGGERHGSGFIISKNSDELAILTAAHVVAGDKYPTVVFLGTRGKKVNAEVQEGSELDDSVRGLALLIVRDMTHVPQDVKVLRLANDDVQVSSGEAMAVLGLPRGAGDWAVIHGHMVSRRGRDLKFNANIDEGASGGPVIRDGQVVGMVQTMETYAQGNPVDSIWVFLQGFGIRKGSEGIAGRGIISSMGAESGISGPIISPIASSLEATKIGKDEAPMVLVLAGEFTMGSPDGEGADDEHPDHIVYLDDFYIDQYEVTVERYQRFMTQTNRATPNLWEQVDLGRDAQKPVVGINWDDAKTYCEWAGKRLPTEAEWEKAARGTDQRMYPWGAFKSNSSTANFGDFAAYSNWDAVYAEKLKRVGSYERGKSPYGAYDMAGNVWEWVADWYSKDYYQASPKKNSQGPSSGEYKVLRGGSWDLNPTYLRAAKRNWTYRSYGYASYGVRCAQDAR